MSICRPQPLQGRTHAFSLLPVSTVIAIEPPFEGVQASYEDAVCEPEDSIGLEVFLDLPHPNVPPLLLVDGADLVDKPLGMRGLKEYVHDFGPPPPEKNA